MINLAQVRAEIPALDDVIYLNTGTFGPLPRVVAQVVRDAYEKIEAHGTFTPTIFQDLELAGFETTRQKAAALLNASREEIALTRNVSDGINIVAHGIDWQPGDEVIISDQEHPSGATPWINLAERRGITIRVLNLVEDEEEILERFAALISPHTRLASLSHVTTMTGLRLPVARLSQIAHDVGIPVLIDGAHAEGQFAVDLRGIGCDFYAACGHKWLLAPQGTGIFYIRREMQERIRPDWLGWGLEHEFNRMTMSYQLASDARRYESSTRAWPLFIALGQAIDFINTVGLGEIEARVRPLAASLKTRLAQIPRVRVHSPGSAGMSTGLVTFEILGREPEALMDELWSRYRIVTNWVRDLNAVRVSVAFFTSEEELDRLLEAIKEIANA